MRILISLALAASMAASSAFAGDNAGPLAAGKPAGVHQAQGLNTTTIVLIGLGAVTAIAVGVASSSNGSPTPLNPPLAVTTTTAEPAAISAGCRPCSRFAGNPASCNRREMVAPHPRVPR